MNNNDFRRRLSFKGISIGKILTSGVILIFLILAFILIKLDIITFGFVKDTITGQNNNEITEEIPDFGQDIPFFEHHYLENNDDCREILASLQPVESYLRKFRVVNTVENMLRITEYTLAVKNNSLRLDTEDKSYIRFEGKTVLKTGEALIDLSETDFSVYGEAGITSLDEVKNEAEKGTVTMNSEKDDSIMVTADNEETGIRNEYLVSVEYGVVLAEKSYINGQVYRIVINDFINLFAAEELSDDYFMIAE